MKRRGYFNLLLCALLTSLFPCAQSYFVDLFVRPSNNVAVGMYEGLGYDVYRKVDSYYAGGGPGGRDEDGFGEWSCCSEIDSWPD